MDNPGEGAYYLDYYTFLNKPDKDNDLQQNQLAKLVAKFLMSAGYEKEASRILNCGQKWIPFKCSAGHVIYRQMTCGLPYCPKCSKTGAWYNKRRVKTVRDVLLGFPMIGHYVFTLPKEISASLPESIQIEKCYKLAWRILREFFDAEASVIVLHFCGDKKAGLHIHFDCSFPVLYRNGDCDYPLEILRLARAEWTAGINKIFKQNFIDTVGHYNFITTLPQQHHLIKYITRSTIEAEKFIELPDKQKEYCIKMGKKKTIRYFGKFIGKQREEFLKEFKCSKVLTGSEGDLISRNICPICNEKMKPMPAVYFDDMPLMNLARYNGYTLIDRQIKAFLSEAEKIRPVYSSLLEYLRAEEVKGGVENGKGL